MTDWMAYLIYIADYIIGDNQKWDIGQLSNKHNIFKASEKEALHTYYSLKDPFCRWFILAENLEQLKEIKAKLVGE